MWHPQDGVASKIPSSVKMWQLEVGDKSEDVKQEVKLKTTVFNEKKRVSRGGMWVSSGIGTTIFVCTRARTISFSRAIVFSNLLSLR